MKILEVVGIRIGTPLLLPFLILGFWAVPGGTAKRLLMIIMAAGALLLVLTPAKVAAHDFYLYGVFPFISIWVAYSIVWLLGAMTRYRRLFLGVIIFAYVAMSVRLFTNPIFALPAPEMQAFDVAKRIAPQLENNDVLIVAGKQSPVFNYYIDHPSWSLDEERLKLGVSYYLKSGHAPRSYPEEILRFERAARSDCDLLKYYRDKGATAIVFPDKGWIASNPDLVRCMKGSVTLKSKDSDPFLWGRIHTDLEAKNNHEQ